MNLYHYAAVVGIGAYPGLGDLVGPVADAADFVTWLGDAQGGAVPAENIATVCTPVDQVFTDPFDARPIKREVDRALETLHRKAKQDVDDLPDRWSQSRLYLYVAGHGIMPGEGETALLLADARPGMSENIELRRYLDWYQRSGIFREVVVFADCCRNWFGQVSPSAVPFWWPPAPVARIFTLVGYAAGPGDPAYEQVEEGIPPDQRRGYFSQALLRGLRGAAPPDERYDAITSATLGGWLSTEVATLTRTKGTPQQVEMRADLGHPIVFAQATRRKTYRVTVHLPAGWTDEVDLVWGSMRPRHVPDGMPWMLDLPSGAYAVVRAGGLDGSPFMADGAFLVSGADRDVHL